ncbi:class I SAM-dependent methyltransferase [Reichenbachiella versicolor]|uniref:class I SAM-dependent methyltransferase n=1 Tax=Reichenbachiella versicolor TaxID=1821036 RepID=UPI000D6E6DFC|nr:class I SAM-dependent methyltransferase [Reichenbachiella versicolor]
MSIYTTEITSSKLVSDNPLHNRLLKAYYLSLPSIKGDLLEVGCGMGRGFEVVWPHVDSYTAIDKIPKVVDGLAEVFQEIDFKCMNVPPFHGIESNSFDTVISFQVIEHIKDDRLFLEEIRRVLKPGGKAFLTTPNITMSLTRNPWHIREYTRMTLERLVQSVFQDYEIYGVIGNEKVMEYYERNKKSVERITRFDLFDFQHRLPAWMLRMPYDILNRMNRMILKKQNSDLVTSIGLDDYDVDESTNDGFDFFCVLTK